MGKKVLIPATVAAVVIILASVYLIYNIRHMADRNREEVRQIAVTSNSIDKKIEAGDIEGIISDSEELKNFRLSETETGTAVTVVIVTAVTAILMIFISSLYLYIRVIRPFYELKDYSADIAAGNLDKPLKVHRGNYFGEFTSAFDDMREELVRTRTSEKEAVEKNKTIISALSHDIKTPVASIKAMADVMSLTAKDDMERETIAAINGKADQIDKLISNLFHATLEELEQLEVNADDVDSTDITRMLVDADYLKKIKEMDIQDAVVKGDKMRLNQVISNIIYNSYKYADTDIRVTSRFEEGEPANRDC